MWHVMFLQLFNRRRVTGGENCDMSSAGVSRISFGNIGASTLKKKKKQI